MSTILMTLILFLNISCQADLDYSDRDKTTTKNNNPASGDISPDTFEDIVTDENKGNNTNTHTTTPTTLDTDGDGNINWIDTDDDGINDADELLIGTDTSIQDTNADGTPDGAEDFDEDGIDNATESNADIGTQTDADGDGNPDISN